MVMDGNGIKNTNQLSGKHLTSMLKKTWKPLEPSRDIGSPALVEWIFSPFVDIILTVF